MQIFREFKNCQHVIYITDSQNIYGIKWLNVPLLSKFIKLRGIRDKKEKERKKKHLKIFNFKAQDAEVDLID